MALSAILIWIPQPVYAAVGTFVLAQWRMLLTGLVILGLAGIAGSTVATRKPPAEEADSNDEAKPLLREIPGWAIWVGIASLVAVGLLATWWLVTTYGSGDAKTIEQNRIKLEAIKLAGSVVVGTGGVAALLLAARRQRVSELDLLQRDRVAEANRHDADERRATELYTAAAEQLASDKAPVRMAGMYALSRLGDSNENLRQTIVNLLCAYLRMPDISIEEKLASDGPPDHEEVDDQRLKSSSQTIVLDLASAPLVTLNSLVPDLCAQQKQERQVRLTAQRLLAQHLRPNRRNGGTQTDRNFWPNMDIDLADADLHEWDFTGCEVRRAEFRGTKFHGDTLFIRVKFHHHTWFNGAEFNGNTLFHETEFHSDTDFSAQFHKLAWFCGAKFQGDTEFNTAQFHKMVWFDGAEFHGHTEFSMAQFHDASTFDGSKFHRCIEFERTKFRGAHFQGVKFRDARFQNAEFFGSICFDEAEFYGQTWFHGAEFDGGARFHGVKFHGPIWFHRAEFHFDTNFNGAKFYNSARFEAAQFHNSTSFNEVAFHSTTWFDGASFEAQPTFKRSFARLALDKGKESTWPAGWTAEGSDPKGFLGDRWRRLIRGEASKISSPDTEPIC